MAKPRRTTKPSKQTGGTFLGIVLGLIVGLAIAVVVALYITRAPSPFVSKVSPPAPAETTASAPQIDLNRSLQGNSPSQPVAPGAQAQAPAQGASTATPGLLQQPQIVEVPGNGASAPAGGNAANNGQSNGLAVAPQPAPAPSEAAPAKRAQTAPPPAATAQAPAKPAANAAQEANSGYFLQVGAYKTPADAEQQRARLAFQGFESKVTQRDAGGVTYYRVRIGPFTKFDDMNAARQRLSEAGIDTAVIRFTKQ
jgi:cell division protein FtsN